MDRFKKKLNGLKHGLKEFHTKKPQVEFFTALLTVPVLLTVIILNVNNLKGNNSNKDSEKNQTIVITQPGNPNTADKEPVVTIETCKEGIGKVTIVNPQENETVSDNPVNVDIKYEPGDYCNGVWSYRVNEGGWSNYDDRSISLYDLPNGSVKFELRVKGLTGSDEETLVRNFVYNGTKTTQTPSPSISPAPSPTPVN
jgi:hypothetical protein